MNKRKVVLAAALFLTAGLSSGFAREPGWIVDARSGCRVWNPIPAVDDRITWDGPCVGGYAQGHGTLRWYSGDKHYETDVGEFKTGKLNGHAVLEFTNHSRFEGEFKDQRPNGQGTWRTPTGKVISGNWSHGCLRVRDQWVTYNAKPEECETY